MARPIPRSPTRSQRRVFESDLTDLLETLGPNEPVSWMVEKDYWLTRVLRRLSIELPGGFLFKGGTSLSMGYSLIERFSEDIDLLVTSDSPDTLITDIARLAEEVLGESPETVREGDAYKFLVYPFRASVRAPARLRNHRTIRVDVGAQGGSHPSDDRQIAPIARGLVEARDQPTDYADLQPFPIRVLHPARTCIEKLEAVHSTSLQLLSGELDSLTSRDGKHPYDIHQILSHQESVELLSDTSQRMEIIRAVDDANQRWYGGPIKRPSNGYAYSPAFAGDETSQLFADSTRRAMDDYLWHGAEQPTWDEMLARVAASEGIL